jgi:cytochrome P450 family 6
LKAAYYLIEKLGKDFNRYVNVRFKPSSTRAEFDLKTITDLFFVDVISSVAFGVEAHTMENSGSEFYKAANSIFDAGKMWRGFELASVFLIPQIMKYFRFKTFSHFTTKFIYEVMPHIMEERVKSGNRRNDLIDALLDVKNELVPEHEGHKVEDILYGQVGVFLAAGYETSSSTTSFTLYELSKQPDLQQRVREEIKSALKKHNGQVPFEMVSSASEMPLLHQAIHETLRLYSVFSTLDRECTNASGVSIDGGSFRIPKGMPILIPVYPLGRDEKYFEDPLRYDPERFSPENINKIPFVLANMAFGTGQRYCIGERLGLIQTKVALVMLLKDFRIESNENTPECINFVKKAMIIQSEKRMLVDFVKDPLI